MTLGGWLGGGGGVTVTECEVGAELAPELSFTVRVTVYDPPALYVCEGLRTVAELPSPKSHCQLTTVPSGSLLWSVKAQVRSVQFDVNSAVGGWFGAVQVIVKLAWPVPFAGTVTDCGLASLTVQFDGTPLSCTEWVVAVTV